MAKAAKAAQPVKTKPEPEAKLMIEQDDELQNKSFDEWEGRVVAIKTKRRDENGAIIHEKKFEPLICKRKNVKITQAEADSLNVSATHTPRQDYVIAYLPAGKGETGEKVVLVEEPEEETE